MYWVSWAADSSWWSSTHVFWAPKTSSLCIQALAKGITESKFQLTASRKVLQAWNLALKKQHCKLDTDCVLCPQCKEQSMLWKYKKDFVCNSFVPLWGIKTPALTRFSWGCLWKIPAIYQCFATTPGAKKGLVWCVQTVWNDQMAFGECSLLYMLEPTHSCINVCGSKGKTSARPSSRNWQWLLKVSSPIFSGITRYLLLPRSQP